LRPVSTATEQASHLRAGGNTRHYSREVHRPTEGPGLELQFLRGASACKKADAKQWDDGAKPFHERSPQ
jgi:hypothetical protein